MHWLPEPPAGASVCLAFDGSETGDHTAIRGETLDGMLFTPRWSTPSGGTTWNPEDSQGRIPRAAVTEAVHALFGRFKVERMYCDPPLWQSEIEQWARELGEEKVIEWPTYRAVSMHSALERFVTDLGTGKLKHDGCPVTHQHVMTARMAHRRDGRYVLAKPDPARKIDAAVTAVLAHEAAADARAAGWGDDDGPTIFFLP